MAANERISPGSPVPTLDQLRQRFFDPCLGPDAASTNRQFLQAIFAGTEDAFSREVLGPLDGDRETSSQRGRFRRILLGEHRSSSARAAALLLAQCSEKTGEGCTFASFPLLRQLEDNWAAVLDRGKAGKAARDRLLRRLTDLYMNDLSPAPPLCLAPRLASLVKDRPAGALAALTLLGCVAYSWNRGLMDEAQRLRLAALLLPPLEERDARAGRASLGRGRTLAAGPCSPDALEAALQDALACRETRADAQVLLFRFGLREGAEDLVRRFLSGAAQAGDADAQYRLNLPQAAQKWQRVVRREALGHSPQSVLDCQAILRLMPLLPGGDNRLRGQACLLLAEYADPKDRPRFARMARLCGEIPEAPASPPPIVPPLRRCRDAREGRCFANVDSDRTRCFARTIPEAWGGGFTPFTEDAVRETLERGLPARFLLAHDDFTKNLHDALGLLQLVQDSPGTEPLPWELFLRGSRETGRALVDTALSRFRRQGLRVHLVDDDQWPAQQLLYAHPLFYPLRKLPLSGGGPRPLLRFFVIGDDPVARELVREAFWMLEFRDDAVEAEIVVLTRDGEAFSAALLSRYPGMRRGAVEIPGLRLPRILVKTVDWETYSLEAAVTDLCFPSDSASPFCYFAVAIGDDLLGLSTATRLREMLVRRALADRSLSDVSDAPPIACLCRSDDVAHLARRLVIENEAYGDQWFNTWALIPFGSLSQGYAWDRLDGGALEQLAQCVHLQYEGLPWDDPEKARNLNDRYFRYQYNRESSFATALSLPYRLFQFRDGYGRPCVPDGWSILDGDAYASVEGLRALAASAAPMGDSALAPGEREALARWEHNRWVKWMLSRGWLPMDAATSAYGYRMENGRHYAFVARQHPCICSYEAQRDLSRYLEASCRITKDFYTYDEKNICATADILALKWLTEEKETDDE